MATVIARRVRKGAKKRKPRASKLDDYKPVIQELVVKKDLAAIRVLREIRALGYRGGYSVLKEYARSIRRRSRRRPHLRFEPDKGRQGQVDLSGHTEVFGDQTTKVVSVSGGRVVLSMAGKEAIVNPDLNLLSGFSIVAGQDVSYSPDLGTLSWPLRKGKQWTNHWKWKAEDYAGEGTTNGKAVGWETVTVPAGTFTALRVDVSYRSIVPANTTCWYLPDANTFAKCDITAAKKKTTIELVSYQPAGSTAER